MDGEGIVWLIAVGWVILSWIMKAVRGAAGRAGRPAGSDDKPDAHELRERRARLQMERAQRQRLQSPTPRESAFEGFRRELERVMGGHVEEEHGPRGRSGSVPLESAEEIEEFESLETEPVVVSLETSGERALRVEVDHDDQVGAIVQRRRAVAEAHSRPHTRADHQRFDQKIRAAPPPLAPTPPVRVRPGMRQAFIWAEILGKPVSER